MKKILFSDLDGTLLRGLGIRIKDRLAIRKERKNGLLFIISSGRNLKLFKQFLLLQRIRFDYAVLGNGSQIINAKKELVHEEMFETCQLVEVLALIIKEFGTGIKMDITVTCMEKTKTFKKYQIASEVKIEREFPNKVSHSCISVKSNEVGQKIFACISSIDFLNVERNGKYIDITAKHVNKAFGVSILVAQVGANKTYAIGDSYNDISMLKAVDFSFAMQSGTKEIKNIADMEVTGIKECLEVIKARQLK